MDATLAAAPADEDTHADAVPARDRWFGIGVGAAIVGGAALVAPIAARHAPVSGAFLPAAVAAAAVAFALTASLLHEQFRGSRSAASAVLTLAYAAAAALLVPFVLTTPHAFGRTGLLGAGPQTAAWIDAAWHLLFSWIVIAYALLAHRGRRTIGHRAAMILTLGVAAFVVIATGVATLGQAHLPRIAGDGGFTATYRIWLAPGILASIGAAGLALLTSAEARTRRQVWLLVLLLALFVETLVNAFACGAMYSYGWYFTHGEVAVAAMLVLMMLQSRDTLALQRATAANARLAERNAQVQAFIALQDAVAAAIPSRPDIIGAVLAFAQRQTGATHSALFVPQAGDLVCEAATGSLDGTLGLRVRRAGSLAGRCADVCELMAAADTATDRRVDSDVCRRLGIARLVAVPIPGVSEVSAVLTVGWERAQAFDAPELQLLELAAKLLTSGLRAADEFATLEESERRYHAVTDTLPQLVAKVDAHGAITFGNARFHAYAGAVPAGERAAAIALVHPADRSLALSATTEPDPNGAFACEIRLRRADGVFRWHVLRAVPLTGSGGTPEWIVTAADIEERRATEAIIAESAAQLARIAENDRAIAAALGEANRLLVMAGQMAHVGHFRLDLATETVSWSDEVARMYGVEPAFVPSLEWIVAAYHPADRADTVKSVHAALADGRPFTYDARIVRPDGAVRVLAASGQVERDADGTIVALFGVLQDVTTMRDGERERERLGERVVAATKAGNIGIWEWNCTTGTTEWDAAMFALYGLPADGPVPAFASWARSIHPSDRDSTTASFRRAERGEAPFDTEFRIVRPNGDIRHIRAIGTLLPDSDSRGARIVGANWDITETRLLADDLREEKERAEQASRAKSDFLARMSHEIRTPMNGVIGFTTLVLDGELSAEQRRYVSLLRDAGRSLLAIINDILDFSKLEAGRIELERIPVNVHALVDGALSIVRSDALPKGVALDVAIASDVPDWVSGDPTRLRQTLLNLLTNALKFTEHGSIRLTVQRAAASSADGLRFEITDTGIGIAPEARHLLFNDFSQLEASTTRRYGGTGLGLAICKRLVEAMGGTIGVESEVGVGSVFWFTADLRAIDAPEAAELDEPSTHAPSCRILVADDNAVNQLVVATLLERDGHSVTIVENGADAVRAVAADAFDLVLMDMQMPVMDGIEATRAIRALAPPANNVAIVALTANAMVEEAERCHAAGMNAHLAKPIDRTLLRRAIARWTHARLAADAPPAAFAVPAAPPAHLTAFADTPTLGIAMLLEIFDGDVERVGQIFSAALSSMESDLACCAASIAADDMRALGEAAHRIKGTSATIGSHDVRARSAALQDAAQAGGVSAGSPLAAELTQAVADFRRDLDAYRRYVATIA